ncbi:MULTISPECIES: ferrochelatase [Rodentibacter]|uniref:ferrochelatase n=1 Tax=Rodentibacter TaxID=1960084 RepID=UPI001CFD9116|nr:ferrochelatase [Rodentibacter sp. JRC1]GJI56661.1 ferrochelatase [Rodentibacter sp. JRC1]
MTLTKKIGVILANLGTPEEPTPAAVSRYLWEFLSDPRIVDLPRWKWWPLLKFVILPPRSKRIAKNYQAIWTEQGSPLLAITKQQQKALQRYLSEQKINAQVEIAMTYGNPSMQSAVEKLLENQVEKIIVLPLYPQYSSTTTGALFDVFAKALKNTRNITPFEFIHSYHLDENYINALVESIKVRLKSEEFLLFSYHGIPLRYEEMGDYYREHCKQTTIAIVDKLGLTENQWGMSFQSRFGREEWLQPYTDKFLESAATQGIHKIAVVCPGFSVDCLETIEEIDTENRENFLNNGGESYQYIPALNADSAHIEMMGKLILQKLA